MTHARDRAERLRLLTLIATTVIVYAGLSVNDFIAFDDDHYVFANNLILRGLTWQGITRVCSHPMVDNWHPLTMMSHMLDVQLFGTWAGGHHLVSLLIHIVNGCLFYRLAARLTGQTWSAFFAALVFLVHPLNVESVAWVAERKNVLCGLFMILTLTSYVRAVSGAGRSWWLAHVWCICALLAKPMAVTLPILLVLLDIWPLRRVSIKTPRQSLTRVAQKTPMLLMCAAVGLVTLQLQRTDGAVSRHIVERLMHMSTSYGLYLKQFFWPYPLTVLYPYDPQLVENGAIWGASALIAISLLVLQVKKPWVWFAWLWFLATLLPVSGIIPIGRHLMTDRYMYIPMLGPLLAAAWAIEEAVVQPRWRAWAAVLCCVLVSALGMVSAHQVARWRDSRTLFNYTLSHTDRNATIALNLAQYNLNHGDSGGAIPLIDEALRWEPNNAQGQFLKGWSLLEANRPQAALVWFQRAEQSEFGPPGVFDYHARALEKLARPTQALAVLESAIKADPDNVNLRLRAGIQAFHAGDDARARMAFNKAIALAPDREDVHFNAAVWHLESGHFAAAQASFTNALAIKPSTSAQMGLARSLEGQGHTSAARDVYRRVLAAHPTNAVARRALDRLSGSESPQQDRPHGDHTENQ